MVGKQFINNVQEIGVPLIKEFVKKKKMEKDEKDRIRRETEKRAASSAEGGSVLPLVEVKVFKIVFRAIVSKISARNKHNKKIHH